MEGCIACDLLEGRLALPGGVIHDTGSWVVEHCVGPLGVGTLIVKPRRHVTRVSELTRDEARELGGVLRLAAAMVDAECPNEQTYVTLWSHSDATPQHIHWVVQPVTARRMADHDGLYGPRLQVAMFAAREAPDAAAVEAVAGRMRAWLAQHTRGQRPG
jgi:diadenosine tetraphosphate (Ap4A) HIT family hydrolase